MTTPTRFEVHFPIEFFFSPETRRCDPFCDYYYFFFLSFFLFCRIALRADSQCLSKAVLPVDNNKSRLQRSCVGVAARVSTYSI